jgi:23S rRNA (uracil1939-C5)-methyltransferase
LRVTIESWAGGGRGVARVDGRVWLVSDALPGEVVSVEAVSRRGGVVEARATAVHIPSPDREPDPCPAAQRCGGCDLAFVARRGSAELLRALVVGGLRHAPPALSAAVGSAPVIVSPPRWRLRSRLHWQPATGVLGFLGRRTHDAVSIEPCWVVSERLLAALPKLAASLSAAGSPVGQVEWLENLDESVAVAGWRGAGAPPPPPVRGLSGWWRIDGRGRHRGWGEDAVTMALPVPLSVPVGAFFQSNRWLVPQLFDRISALVGEAAPEVVVDLYGGVGFLAAAARQGGAKRILLVEADATAARAAAGNLPGVDVAAARVEAFLLTARRERWTLAILDPPRTGLSDIARARLIGWRPDALIVLACDVSRFGRDAAALLSAGYSLRALELWDMFAGSHHVEILASFQRD